MSIDTMPTPSTPSKQLEADTGSADTTYEERDGRPVINYVQANDSPQRGSLGKQGSASLISNASHDNSGSGRSGLSSRSHRSSRSNFLINQSSRVVFSSPAKYDNWIWVILSIPLLLILTQLIIVLVVSAKRADFQRSQTAWVLGWTMILIFGLYMMVLPKRVDVRSNGTIGIKTILVTYQFPNVCRAYIAGAGREDFVRPRYKFATCLESPHRIVVRRKGGLWDVVVSPSEPEEFLKALEEVVAKLELQNPGVALNAVANSETENLATASNNTKPDLSSV